MQYLNSCSVNIVLTSYNHAEYTNNALLSLSRTTPRGYTLYVLDDHSTDDVKVVVERFPFANFVGFACHRGLTALWNDAYGLALKNGADYLVLCNNDVKFSEGWLVELISAMQEHDIAVPVTNAPGHNKAQNVRAYMPDYQPDDSWQAVDEVSKQLAHLKPLKADKINGFCMMLKMSWLKSAVGTDDKPFDEAKFPLYGAEDDFFTRHKPDTVIVPSSFIFHYKAVSTAKSLFPSQNYRMKETTCPISLN